MKSLLLLRAFLCNQKKHLSKNVHVNPVLLLRHPLCRKRGLLQGIPAKKYSLLLLLKAFLSKGAPAVCLSAFVPKKAIKINRVPLSRGSPSFVLSEACGLM